MKITLSKKQWETIGQKTGWLKSAQMFDNSGETDHLDLFEVYSKDPHSPLIPKEVLGIIDFYNEEYGTIDDYELCEKMKNELEQIGYTCDYGLDGIPFGLQKKN